MKTKSNKKPVKVRTRVLLLVIALITSFFSFLNVSTMGNNSADTQGIFSVATSTKGTYVIEDLNVQYYYDNTKYDVVSLSQEPYATIKGDKQLLNLLKWGKAEPEFYVDLTGKGEGTYKEPIKYSGINNKLQVSIFSSVIELQVIKKKEGIVKHAKLEDKDNKTESTTTPEANIGKVTANVDASKLIEHNVLTTVYSIFDKEGVLLNSYDIETNIKGLKLPLESKDTKDKSPHTVKTEVKTDSKQEKNDSLEKDKTVTVPDKSNKVIKEDNEKELNHSKKEELNEGKVTYEGKRNGLILTDNTDTKQLTSDVTIDISDFDEGKHHLKLKVNGKTITIKFTLKKKQQDKPSESTKTDKGKPSVKPEIPKEQDSQGIVESEHTDEEELEEE